MKSNFLRFSFLSFAVFCLFMFVDVNAALVKPEIVSFTKTAEEENALTLTFKSNNTTDSDFSIEIVNAELGSKDLVAGSATSYTFQNLEPGEEYSVVIRSCLDAKNNYKCSDASATVKATVPGEKEDDDDDDTPEDTPSTPSTPTIESATLSKSSYTYNGSSKKPSVTVLNSSGAKLVKNTDYTVTYPTNTKNIGAYTVVVKGKGKYSFTKNLFYKIIPANVTSVSATKGSKKFTVKWKKAKGGVKYKVGYKKASSKGDYKYSAATTSSSKTISGLSGKTKYKYVVKTFKKVGNKTYANTTSYKTITTKK